MQLNIELRNLPPDERTAIARSLRRNDDDVEIVVRARTVEMDNFGRDTVLRCTGAQIEVAPRAPAVPGRGSRPWVELHLGGNGSPSRRPPNPMETDPFMMPPPVMPAWAGDIGDTPQRLAEIQRRRREEADEQEDREEPGGLTFRFGHRDHGWGR